MDLVELNEELRQLVKCVFEERKGYKNCRSAKDNIDMNVILQAIIDDEFYKKDYQKITEKVVFDKLDYASCIESLQRIVDYKLF